MTKAEALLKLAPEVFLFYRAGQLHHIHTDRKVFEDWMEKSPWQYPPNRCEIVRYIPEAASQGSAGGERSAVQTDDLVAALNRVIGHDPTVPGLSYDTVAQLLTSAAHAAKDALAALGVAQGSWMPVDTAPLDEEVLLGWWREWPERLWEQASGLAGSTKGGWLHGQATHWQRLPGPPGTPQPAGNAYTAKEPVAKAMDAAIHLINRYRQVATDIQMEQVLDAENDFGIALDGIPDDAPSVSSADREAGK